MGLSGLLAESPVWTTQRSRPRSYYCRRGSPPECWDTDQATKVETLGVRSLTQVQLLSEHVHWYVHLYLCRSMASMAIPSQVCHRRARQLLKVWAAHPWYTWPLCSQRKSPLSVWLWCLWLSCTSWDLAKIGSKSDHNSVVPHVVEIWSNQLVMNPFLSGTFRGYYRYFI